MVGATMASTALQEHLVEAHQSTRGLGLSLIVRFLKKVGDAAVYESVDVGADA
jgi:hypothetical protein